MMVTLEQQTQRRARRQEERLMSHEEALVAHQLARDLGNVSVQVVKKPGEVYQKRVKIAGRRSEVKKEVPEGKVLASIEGIFPKPEANHSIRQFRQQVSERMLRDDAEQAGLGRTLEEIHNLPEPR